MNRKEIKKELERKFDFSEFLSEELLSYLESIGFDSEASAKEAEGLKLYYVHRQYGVDEFIEEYWAESKLHAKEQAKDADHINPVVLVRLASEYEDG